MLKVKMMKRENSVPIAEQENNLIFLYTNMVHCDDNTNRMIAIFGWGNIRVWDARKLVVKVDLQVPENWSIVDVSEDCSIVVAGYRKNLYIKKL